MTSFLKHKLTHKTSIFGLRFYVVLGICFGVTIVIIMILMSLYFFSKSRKTSLKNTKKTLPQKPIIQHTTDDHIHIQQPRVDPVPEPDPNDENIRIEMSKENRVGFPGLVSGSS